MDWQEMVPEAEKLMKEIDEALARGVIEVNFKFEYGEIGIVVPRGPMIVLNSEDHKKAVEHYARRLHTVRINRSRLYFRMLP